MSREMTKSEAISNLNQIYGIVSPNIQRSLDLAIKALEERPQGEWIPVSEKLPPNYILCLFCDIDGNIFYGHRNSKNQWREECQDYNVFDVVAWQELPEPYKKGGAE